MNSFALPEPRRRLILYLSLFVLFVLGAIASAHLDVAWSQAARTWSGPGRELVEELIGVVRLFGRGEIAVFLALLVGALGYRRQAAQILVSLVVVAVVVTAVKFGVGRLRPNGSPGYSFPSGDVATVTAVVLPMAAAQLARLPMALMLIAAVGYGRVHQGYHYPSDVAAGAATGALAALIADACLAGRVIFPGARLHLLIAILFAMVALALRALRQGTIPGELALFLTIFAPVLLAALALRYHRALRYWVRARRLSMTALGWATLLLIAALCLVWLSGRSTLWDRDEPRFATASLEMDKSHDLLVPTFNGEPRLHKPAGIYWLMAPVLAVTGPEAWAARLPAVLATIITAALTWFIGMRLRDSATGIYAASIILVTPLVLVSGTGATTDAALLALGTGATAILIDALVRRDRASEARLSWRSTIGLGACLGGGLLVKGPMALLPILTMLLTCFFLRHTIILARSFWWRFSLACLIGLALFAAWGVPALIATKGAFYTEGVGKHIIQRGAEAMESHHGGPWYYPGVVVLAFFPWSCLLPLAWASLGRWTLLGRSVVLCWFIPALVFLSCYATKLPSYILPTFPALALTIAVLVRTRGDAASQGVERRYFLAARVLLCVPAILIATALLVLPWARLMDLSRLSAGAQRSLSCLKDMDGLVASTLGLALVFLFMARAGNRALRDGRLRQTTAVLFTGMAACALSLGMAGLPSFERYKPSRPMARAIQAVTAPSIPVWVADYDEPSLHFYLNRGVVLPIPGNDVAAWSRQPGTAVLVLSRGLLDASQVQGRLPLKEITTQDIGGMNLANGHWVELVAVARGL